jgi:hypothetical protein
MSETRQAVLHERGPILGTPSFEYVFEMEGREIGIHLDRACIERIGTSYSLAMLQRFADSMLPSGTVVISATGEKLWTVA